MPLIKRRRFLQFAGTALTTLGIGQLEIEQTGLQFGKVLAQDTRRKRALLVGINNYPALNANLGQWYRLQGAVNDVQLQQELLIHRFGFHPDDILVLTDQEANRKNILEKFETHLIQGVQSDNDVVVFHYSGHGSTVVDPHKVFPDELNGTIVPIDADLPNGYPQAGGEVNDITAGTLFLLREALTRKTKNVTFILDSCYSGGGVRGNVIVRSRPGQLELRGDSHNTKLESSQEELDYQHRWLTDLQLSEAEWIERRRNNLVGGAVIFAAQRNQGAVDATFATDVHAGLFTYALTRQLWQQTSTQEMGKAVFAAAAKTEQLLQNTQNARMQNPDIEVRAGSADAQQPIYFTPMQQVAAEAIVTEVEDAGQSVKLLLTGVEPQSLEALGRGAIFTLVDDRGKPQGTVEITARDRLTATGTLQAKEASKITPGTALQEQVRAIPTDLKLRIGLDRSLEQEAATTALRSLPRVEVVPLLEQEVDYILGRMLPAYHQELVERVTKGLAPDLQQQAIAELPKVNSVGLFSIGFDYILGSFYTSGETIGDAVDRLQIKLRLLLTARLIKLTLNTNSSRLKVAASLKVADSQTLLAHSFTVRGENHLSLTEIQTIDPTAGTLAQIKVHKSVQILVQNQDNCDLHIGIFVFSPDGDIDILFPLSDEENAALVRQGQALQIPNATQIQTGTSLSFREPLGIAEILIVASTKPIQKALMPLQTLAEERKNPQRSESHVAETAEIAIASLLDDLVGVTRDVAQPVSEVRQVDIQQMAALSISLEIVAA